MKQIMLLIGFMIATQSAQAETIYRASIIVGGRIFQDLFVINGLPDNPYIKADLTGSVTVPGNFSVPMTGKMQRANPWLMNDTAKITLNIVAIEHGEKFKVRYEMSTQDMIHIQGTGYLENGEKLGDFIGERIFKD